MVGLKTFFRAEKGPYSADPGDHEHDSTPDDQSTASGVTAPNLSPPSLPVLQPDDGGQSQNTHRLRNRFGQSRDTLQARPMTSWSQAPSATTSGLASQGSRHIDLVEALFTSHRYRIESAKTMSPTSPYNEDIAERNMTRFLRGQSKKGLYSHFVSALYGEDVADKNIAASRKSTHSSRPGSRSRPNVYGNHTPQSTPRSRKRNSSGHPDARRRDGQLARPASQEGIRFRPPADEHAASAREQWRRRSHLLRAQMSEPNLSAENDSHAQALLQSVGQLPALPAYNGKRLSSSPDSPTVPIPPRGVKNIYEHRALAKATLSRSSSMKSNDSSPSASRPSSPGRNIRDLSINTELATRGKATPKISHRAIQPPTPGNQDMRQNPSIAEVMNTPVPDGTPTTISPAKVEEIMDMFKQAYIPSQTPNANMNTQSTFESLQDAIIRQVNSHEALRSRPVPAPGPPFTPSQEAFGSTPITPKPSYPGLRRSISAKEGQFAKLIKVGSSKKHHRRGSESGKSLSFLPKGSDKLLRFAPGSARRRRHTDAPPPSAGLFDSDRSKQGPEDQVTYMDVLMCSGNESSAPRHNSDPTARNISRSQSTASLSRMNIDQAPSVCYMRAQTSASLRDSRTRFSAYNPDDDNDSIIHLPSVETPRAQVHGVDKNNVKYIVQNSTPSDAYKLMDWPQRTSRHSNSDHESHFFNDTNSFPLPPLSRPGQQLRMSRSMETY